MKPRVLLLISFLVTVFGVLLVVANIKKEKVNRPFLSPVKNSVKAVLPVVAREPEGLVKDGVVDFESVFEYQFPEMKPDKTRINLAVTGDVLLARAVDGQLRSKNDWNWPFLKTADFLKRADIVLINLETPLTKSCTKSSKGMVFCGDVQSVSGLKFAGVDVVGIANNHIYNAGKDGLSQTVALLKDNGFRVAGEGEKAIFEVKGKKFGFLAYNDVGSKVQSDLIKSDIQKLRVDMDFIVVLFHWGEEYRYAPTLRQQELAHLTVDAGADLVVGNHPHWVQAVEVYKDHLIAYSHGNFVFDQEWSRETKEGVVGEYDFGENGLVGINYFPVVIEDYGQPRFAEKNETEKILGTMKNASDKINLKAKQ